MIRVLIVDDHAVVRAGLRRLLDAEPDIETVGEAPNADRAVFEALESRPDVVLMDLVMPEKSGIEGMPAAQIDQRVNNAIKWLADKPQHMRLAANLDLVGMNLKNLK